MTYSSPVEGKLNVSWWTYNSPAWVAGNIEMIKRFQAANPDINIVYQYFPYDVLISKLQAGYNAGTVADMQQMFGTWVTDYAAFGLLDPVPAQSGRGLHRSLLAGVDRRLGYNGQYYGMPKEINLENGCMLVNPAILQEAGVTEQPATWQENDRQRGEGHHLRRSGPHHPGRVPVHRQRHDHLPLPGDDPAAGRHYWADDGVHVNFQTDAAKKAWQDEIDLITKYHVDDETSYAGDR